MREIQFIERQTKEIIKNWTSLTEYEQSRGGNKF